MKNNKGFTVVELLASFLLASVIIIILFQLIISLKELYQTSGIKTELVNQQNIMINKIYSDLTGKEIAEISSCGQDCVGFTFSDGTEKTFSVDTTNKTINYDNYKIKLKDKSSIEGVNINVTEGISSGNNIILNIDIPVHNENFKNEDFGINIVYTFNNSNNNIANSYGNTYVSPTDTYEAIPYIKSNGNQYINLGYKAKINTEIRLDIELIENANTNVANKPSNIIGRDTVGDTNTFTVNFGSNANEFNMLFYWVDKTYSSGAEVKKNTYATVLPRSMMIVKSGSATFQGVTHEIANKTGICSDNMVLLGSYTSSTNPAGINAFNRYDAKIYGLQIYEGNNIIMNLKPAKSTTTNKIGLFDTISKQFFISNGSSDFIYE